MRGLTFAGAPQEALLAVDDDEQALLVESRRWIAGQGVQFRLVKAHGYWSLQGEGYIRWKPTRLANSKDGLARPQKRRATSIIHRNYTAPCTCPVGVARMG